MSINGTIQSLFQSMRLKRSGRSSVNLDLYEVMFLNYLYSLKIYLTNTYYVPGTWDKTTNMISSLREHTLNQKKQTSNNYYKSTLDTSLLPVHVVQSALECSSRVSLSFLWEIHIRGAVQILNLKENFSTRLPNLPLERTVWAGF